MRSDQINELALALAKAQGAMKPASKSSVNPHFKSKYADLASVWETIREPLAQNGLSVTQTLGVDANSDGTLLYTMLMHSSGQYVGSVQQLLPRDKTPQGLAAALTYARRQSLQAIVGVAADEDDDGNEASGRIVTETTNRTALREPVRVTPQKVTQPQETPKEQESSSLESYVPKAGRLKGVPLSERGLLELETYILEIDGSLVKQSIAFEALPANVKEVYRAVKKEISRRESEAPEFNQFK